MVLGTLAAFAILILSGMQIAAWTMVPLLGSFTILGAAHIIYGRYRQNIRIELASGVLAMMVGSAISAGIISNAGLRLRRPLIDTLLVRADHAIGVDTPALVRAFAEYPMFNQILDIFYTSAFPTVFVVALWFAARGRTREAWEIGWSFSASILCASFLSALYPAIGNTPHAHLEGLSGHGLPEGSGIFYVAAFRALHDGFDPVLDMRHLEGVVTFPSFHAVMAIIVAWALRRTGMAGWLAAIWCVMVILSTIPIGGHYVIDLVGGAALWAMCVAVVRRDRTVFRTAQPQRQSYPPPRSAVPNSISG